MKQVSRFVGVMAGALFRIVGAIGRSVLALTAGLFTTAEPEKPEDTPRSRSPYYNDVDPYDRFIYKDRGVQDRFPH